MARTGRPKADLTLSDNERVGKWRKRFIDRRLDGLCDEPRPGREPVITDEQVEKVIVDTLEETPDNATHWSRAS
jgi:hypothetical protein